MKLALFISLITNVLLVGCALLKLPNMEAAIKVDYAKGPGGILGQMNVPLGSIITLEGVPEISEEFPGQEVVLRLITIDGIHIKNETKIPATGWDGIQLSESIGKTLCCKGYERIEEIGYSDSHWRLAQERMATEMSAGNKYDPAMTPVRNKIRTVFLVVSAKELPSKE